MKKIVTVMPVANEQDTMRDVIDKIMALPFEELYLYPVIDSYSKDRTEEIIKQAERDYNGKVRLLFHSGSTGAVSCYFYGFKQAIKDGADYIVEMDGGGSHDPNSVPMFIEKLDEGYDCVWGSRFIKGGGMVNHPLYRRMLSGGGTFLSNLVLGTKLKDMTSGFEAFRADILAGMDLDKFLSKGHMYQTEMRYYCRNFKTVEVPITYIGSSSSLKASSVTTALKLLFKLKKNEKNIFIDRQANT